jgi:hypothetical protein
MDLNDITKKAKTFLEDDKVRDALKSEKAEDVSDKLLDAVSGAAQKVTGSKYDDQITKARDAADKKLGNQ